MLVFLNHFSIYLFFFFRAFNLGRLDGWEEQILRSPHIETSINEMYENMLHSIQLTIFFFSHDDMHLIYQHKTCA